MKAILVTALVVMAGALIGLPLWAALSGRDGLVMPFVAVGLAALCSFIAYRGSVALRRRIDSLADPASAPKRHRADR